LFAWLVPETLYKLAFGLGPPIAAAGPSSGAHLPADCSDATALFWGQGRQRFAENYGFLL
jgi:hypothetical protein